MTLEEFMQELTESSETFNKNISAHPEVSKRADLNFADWFDTFRAWCEVGTDVELQHHGERVLGRADAWDEGVADSIVMNLHDVLDKPFGPEKVRDAVYVAIAEWKAVKTS